MSGKTAETTHKSGLRLKTSILLTSAGRRSYLVRYFREALGPGGLVVCADSRASAPAGNEADHFYPVSDCASPSYPREIAAICRKHQVRALFSGHDLDTHVLSHHQQLWASAGVQAFLPSPEWSSIALDKLRTYHALVRHGISCPWTTDDPEEARLRMAAGRARGDTCPLVIKARFGFGSLGLRLCTQPEDLGAAYRSALAEVAASAFAGILDVLRPGESRLVLQDHVAGREICLNVVNDLAGQHLSTLATEIEGMRAGESDAATTLPVDGPLADLGERLGALTGHIGIWGVDCIDQDGMLHVLDLNPRFTGDYPFSHLAGANIPRALLALVAGEPASPTDLRCEPGVRGYKDLVPRLCAAAPEPQRIGVPATAQPTRDPLGSSSTRLKPHLARSHPRSSAGTRGPCTEV